MFKVLVTGASQGIGAALAHEFAKRGGDLILTARSQNRLEQVAEECRKLGSKNVRVLPADLSNPESWNQIVQAATDFKINTLVNNAGYGLWGDFAEIPLEELQKNMRLNMDSLVALTHRLIPVLKESPRGYILNVASTTAYQALPTFAVYAATKSFVLSWSRAIHHELKKQGVWVTALVPGATDTGFIGRAGLQHMEKTAKKVSMTSKDVAKFGIENLLRGRNEAIPGFLNKFSAQMIPLVPKKWVEKAAASIYVKK